MSFLLNFSTVLCKLARFVSLPALEACLLWRLACFGRYRRRCDMKPQHVGSGISKTLLACQGWKAEFISCFSVAAFWNIP